MIPFASTAKQALKSIGAYRALLAAVPYHGVAVLAYHGVRDDRWPPGAMHFEALHVRASRLEAHCRALRDLGCSMLAFDDWQAIINGTTPVPPRAVMMTFDDGYCTVLTHALPILQRHAIPATVFVCTAPIERGVRFWWDALAERVGEGACEAAKALSYDAWRDLAFRHEMQARGDDPHAPLTIPELRTLAANPLITIGAHTVTHPILARASAEQQRQEIELSRLTLEAWTGRPIQTFAYPNGRPGIDFNDLTVATVRALGFDCAFAVGHGFADPQGPRHEHRRLAMLDSVTDAELAHRLTVSWPRLEAAAS